MLSDYREDMRPVTSGQKALATRSKWSCGIEAKLALVASMDSTFEYIALPIYFLRSGSGALFIVLVLMFAALFGVPMLLLDVGVGQFMDRGTWCAWNIAPLFKGIGYLTTITNSQIMWLFLWMLMVQFLFFHHLVVTGPVSAFDNCTNVEVYIDGTEVEGATHDPLGNLFFPNGTVLNATSEEYDRSHVYFGYCGPTDPWSERWSSRASQTPDVDGVQVLVMLLMILLVCGLTATRRCGIGKISALCVIAPYLLTLMLFVRVITLPGGIEGIKYGFYPVSNNEYYHATDVGRMACAAVLAMFAVGRGTSVTVGAYNRFNHNFLLDCIVVVVLKLIMAIFIVCTMLGAFGVVSFAVNIPLRHLETGWIYALPVVTEAFLVHTPSGSFWAACFLISVLLSSVGGAVWTAESVVVAIRDLMPRTPRFRLLRRRPVLLAVCAVPWFGWGIAYCTKRSLEAAYHLDAYCTSPSMLLLVALLECVAIGWVYGARRFQANWTVMQGRCACPYPVVFWAIITPIVLFAMLIANIYWAGLEFQIPGLSSFVFALFLIGISGLVLLGTRPAFSWRQKWRLVTTPWDLAPHQMQPHNRRYDTVAMTTIAR